MKGVVWMSLNIAAISRLNCPHHIDHLLPLCDLLGGTFVTCEEDQEQLAHKFYPPGVKIEFIDNRVFTSHIQSKYDVLIHTFPFSLDLMNFSFSGGKKKMRALYTPHGNSEKGLFSKTYENYVHNDITLLYGPQMKKALDYLKVSLKSFAFIGNIRHHYYQQHQRFFDEKAEKEIFLRLDPHKKTILYAPTFEDSLFSNYEMICTHLPKKYNLIIKLHPWQEKEDIAKLYYIMGKYEQNVFFLENFPLVFPLLSKADIYLGDISSIGYDFLLYNKPMFFLSSSRPQELYECGTIIPEKIGAKILNFIEKHLEKDADFQKKRQKLFEHAFDTSHSITKIKETILQLCLSGV